MKKLDFSFLKGEVFYKDTNTYEEKRMAWNRAIDKKPTAIAYCENIEDIKGCIALARKEELSFRIRSGAHHYEGFSTGDDVLVIDVSKMNNIDIDLEKNTVTIEAGVRNRELYEAIGEHGIPFPGGGCPTVGVVGYTLGGGWGFSCRHLGLGIDNLISLEMIDYNGNLLYVDNNKNKDLFWALKGAGAGNFGVVTSMTFNLPKKEEKGTLVVCEIKNTNLDILKNIFKAWDKNIKSLDERLNMKIAFYNDLNKGIGVKITGIFYGEKLEAEKEIRKLLLDYNWELDLREMRILDINRWIQDSHPDYEKYKSSGRFVKDYYEDFEIENILNILKEKAEGSVYTAISLYGLGGNVLKGNKEDSAFLYRESRGILGFQSVWEEDKFANINKKWIVENIKIIKELTKGSFVSFPLAELCNYEEEYFGENSKRLKEVKKKYDPLNVFNFEQSIKL